MKVEFHETSFTLKQGDIFEFRADIAHAYKQSSEVEAPCVIILDFP